MSRIYNAIISSANKAVEATRLCPRLTPGSRKIRQFAAGQRHWLADLKAGFNTSDPRPTYWFHAASLGEFCVARPVIQRLSADHGCRIVLTFFSATGYEALKHRTDIPEIDYVGYLPLDTPRNVRQFLDIVKPAKAIFTISEYWINYLTELKRRNIPTYLLSALITRNAPFFKWYGKPYRRILDSYTRILVLNDRSRELLRTLGCTNVTVTGDPLFDNAVAIASQSWTDTVIERFKGNDPVFIAGSISDWKDLELCSAVANHHPGLKCIFVPHEINRNAIRSMANSLRGKSICYSECDDSTDLSQIQTLIIDHIGDLAKLYRYGTYAYIGGGFTPRLHSIIEATVYGLPTCFGPEIHRKATPTELAKWGIGEIVHDTVEINRWIDRFLDNADMLEKIREKALEYTRRNSGAAAEIAGMLSE
ncbi:MAG: 3-deoxy-D-manno-octulosonic acid transferase [Muribaculaceae bacterium]|nr:3-deoxy-D-manno-octulosonic acid transferase [Muribaculaceae bacterium]